MATRAVLITSVIKSSIIVQSQTSQLPALAPAERKAKYMPNGKQIVNHFRQQHAFGHDQPIFRCRGLACIPVVKT